MTTDSYSVSSAYAMYWIIRESVSSWLELRLVTAFCWIECPSGEVKAYIWPWTKHFTVLFVINGAALSLRHTPRSISNNWTLFSREKVKSHLWRISTNNHATTQHSNGWEMNGTYQKMSLRVLSDSPAKCMVTLDGRPLTLFVQSWYARWSEKAKQ